MVDEEASTAATNAAKHVAKPGDKIDRKDDRSGPRRLGLLLPAPSASAIAFDVVAPAVRFGRSRYPVPVGIATDPPSGPAALSSAQR